ncbi:sigma-70 family RNA polymerase sigma factor [bacterium]|nr:sigma-70 family RNA polymerase sigma factor [bacterium]
MPAASDDDRELMSRAQRGERPAFDDIVGRYYRGVFSYARRVLGDDDRAAEATQETFVRAFRYRASYKPAAGSVRGWIFAVAANRIREARKERREGPEALDDQPEPEQRGEAGLEAFARGALREEVGRALEELAPEHREVIALKYLSELSYEDVARALGLSVSAAKMRALRARDLLAQKLARLVMDSESGDGEP